MELSLLAGFVLVSLTLACTPGADWAYIISSAISKHTFVPAVLGLLSGYLFHTALVAGGIAAVVAGSPWLLSRLTTAGAIYLFWLGITTLRSWKSAGFHERPAAGGPATSPAGPVVAPASGGGLATMAPSRAASRTGRADFLKGLLTSATNPKALLLYVALIPQFITQAAAWPLPAQTAALGLTHFVVSIAVYFGVALTARILLRSRPVAARVVTLFSGLIMVILAIGLVVEQLILT